MAMVVVMVFDFFFFSMGLVFNFVCGLGCGYRLWLKWWFNGCVGSGLVAVVLVW